MNVTELVKADVDFTNAEEEMERVRPYLEALRTTHAHEKAEKLGLEIVVPDAHTLTLDFDIPEDEATRFFTPPKAYWDVLTLLESLYTLEDTKVTTSVHGGRHYYLRFDTEFTETEKVALQAAMGSDPKREALGCLRIKNNLGEGSLMFEVPTPEGPGF